MILILRRYLALFCFLALTVTALAQTSRFTGVVTDPQSAVIAGVDVQAMNLESLVKLSTKTDKNGAYTIPFLPAGTYEVIVQAPGFSIFTSGDLKLSVGQALLYNIQLAVGPELSTVTVNGSSEVTEVNTENAEIAGTITRDEVVGLQLNGRNFTQLIALTPGVSNQTQQDEAKVGLAGSVAYSVNGGRTEYNSFQVDGAETLNVGINKDHSTLIVYPSVDAIQEIKVLTSNYGAQYPSSGSGTTLVTTRSGTDTFHGNLYEFLRNEDFNAKGYFDIGNSAPLYRRNDFGGTIGGPVWIPRVHDGRSKTHFFFSEEARAEKTPTAYRQAVPSTAEHNGDFSDVCPTAGATYSQAQYPDCPGLNSGEFQRVPSPAVPVSPVATAILNTGIIPFPNAISGCNSSIGSCYDADVSLPLYYREELLKLDHQLTQKTQVSFHYIHDEYSNTNPTPLYGFIQNTLPTIWGRVYAPGLSMAGRVTSSISSKLANEAVVSYTNSHLKFTDLPGGYISLQRPVGLSQLGSIFNNGFGGKLTGVNIAGNNAAYGGTGFAVDPSFAPWEHSNPTYSFSDNLTWSWRSHTVQVGAQWIIFQRNQLNNAIGSASGDVQGLLTFSNQNSSYTTGNAFADFILWGSNGGTYDYSGGGLGGPSSFQQDSTQNRYYQRYQIGEPYLQDDWKVNHRLTLNLGVRLSLFGTFHEKNHNAYNWEASAYSNSLAEQVEIDPITGGLLATATGRDQTPIYVPVYGADGQPDPRVVNGVVRCGVNSVPDGCMKGHLWNPAPRIGIAWDPWGNGKTAIRGGYGIFYEHGTADEANTGSLEGNASLVLSMTQRQPYRPECIGHNRAVGDDCLGPAGAAFPIDVTAIPNQVVWPYVQQWSMSAEQALPGKMLATVGYVGSKGTHLTLERELNQLRPAPAALNPYGQHEPLLYQTCQDAGSAGGLGGQLGYFNYTLPGGQFISYLSPLAHNMEAACSGIGAGGENNPVTLRTFAYGLNNIYSLENIANSNYNGLQVTLRRTEGPISVGLAYTFSHSFDNSSDRSDSTFVDSYNVRSNRASSSFDQRQLFHASYIYELPLLPLLQNFLSTIHSDPDPENHTANKPPHDYLAARLYQVLLNRWQFSGITLFETGIPFTVLNGGSANGVSVLDNAGVDNGVGAGSYPDLVGNPNAGHSKMVTGATSFGPLLNPSAFAAPRGLTFGNAGRNVLNNPRRWNFDMALEKGIPIKEGVTVRLRTEAFNVFNHTQFRIYNPTLGNQANNTVSCYGATSYSAGDSGCLTNSSFLHPIDAHRPRTLQFGLKLEF